MLSRRSLLAASGASAVGLGAAACGADPDSFAQGPIDFDTDGELEGSIRLLTPDFVGDARPDFDAMIEAFHEQNPGVEVIVDQTDWDKLNEKLSTSIAGGLVPDVIMSGVGWTPPFAHKNIFGQIPDSYIDTLDLEPSVLKPTLYEGSSHSLPVGLDCRFLVYHPGMLEDRGITEPPRDLDELAQVAEELTGDGVVGLDLLTTNIRQAWIHLLYAFGGTQFSEDGLTTTMTEEPGRRATQWVLDLMETGAVNYDLQAAEGQPTPFQRGDAAMQLVSTGVWNTWEQMTPELTEEGAVGMFLLPGAEGVDPVMFQGGTLVSVSRLTENQPASAALVKHLMTPDMLARGNAATAKVPPTPDIPETEEISTNYLTTFALEHLASAGAAEGGTPAWMEIRGNLQPHIEGCLTGRTTLDEMFSEIQTLCDDAIGRL